MGPVPVFWSGALTRAPQLRILLECRCLPWGASPCRRIHSPFFRGELVRLLWISRDAAESPPEVLVKSTGAPVDVTRRSIAALVRELRSGVAVAPAYDLIGLSLAGPTDALLAGGVQELLAGLASARGLVVGEAAAIEQLSELPASWLAVSRQGPELEQRGIYRLLADMARSPGLPPADARDLKRGLERPLPSFAPAPNGAGAVTVGPGSARSLQVLGEVAQRLLQQGDHRLACRQFLLLLQECLGIGRLAVFLRWLAPGWAPPGGQTTPDDDRLHLVSSLGIGVRELGHLHLSLRGGIARIADREARVVLREELAQHADREAADVAAKEFELLGTHVAVPLFDSRQCRGILTVSHRVAGDGFGEEELVFVFRLGAQLAAAMERLDLVQRSSAQHALFEGVLRDIQSGVIVVAGHMQVVFCNPAAAALLGIGDEALVLGRDAALLPAPIARLVYAAGRGEEPAPSREEDVGGRPVGIRLIRFRPPLPSAEPGAGETWLILVLEDATEEQRRREAAALGERERFMRQLADRLSHELRNALVPMRTFVQLLPERYQEEAFRDSFSRVVGAEVDRIETLLDKLTFFTAPAPEVLGRVSLHDAVKAALLEEAIALHRRLGTPLPDEREPLDVLPSERRMSIQIEREWLAPGEPDQVTADYVQLVGAIREVVRNAIQAMPDGGVLRIGCRRGTGEQAKRLLLEISDGGEGFRPGEDPTAPFQTTRSVGPGLGLTLVRKVVEAFHGKLVLSTQEPRGARVVLELPAAGADGSD